MKVHELLKWFDEHKSTNKNDLSNNIHKVFEVYRFVDSSYLELDVSIILTNITHLFDVMKKKYKPTTVRNYLRYMLLSCDLDVVKGCVSEDIVKKLKDECSRLIKIADKEANKLDKKKEEIDIETDVATSISSVSIENPEEDVDLDITALVPDDDEITIHDAIDEATAPLSTQNEYIVKLETENRMLKEEVLWLRKLVEKMV